MPYLHICHVSPMTYPVSSEDSGRNCTRSLISSRTSSVHCASWKLQKIAFMAMMLKDGEILRWKPERGAHIAPKQMATTIVVAYPLPCSCLLGRGYIPSGRNFGPATCHGDEKDFRIFLHANYMNLYDHRKTGKQKERGVFLFHIIPKKKSFLLGYLYVGSWQLPLHKVIKHRWFWQA